LGLKIYLDMDGVLCDFANRYHELLGIRMEDAKSKDRRVNFAKFVEDKSFEKLKMFPSAYVLLEFVKKSGVPVEILSSSTADESVKEEVTRQKLKWLATHSIRYKANIVPGGMKKGQYANADTVLIDDTERVVDNFRKAGGKAILHDHNNVKATIEKLNEYFM
jgi:phosphoglycolate phosphatase-like HAD superfamily hydrolase